MKLYKKYIDVMVLITKEGNVIPTYLFWDERGIRKRYQIDKIIEIKNAASSVGGCGIRYKCLIGGKEKKLFYEKDKWFVESLTP